MKDVAVPIIVALIAGLSAGGLLPILQIFRGRGRAQAEAVDALSTTARKWVEDFSREATDARAELRLVRTEAAALARELQKIRIAIMAPNATIAELRILVDALGGQP